MKRKRGCTFRKELASERSKLLRILKNQGLSDRIIQAIGKVPREEFIPKELVAYSYENHPLAIGSGQTISQPYIVGYMLDELDVRPTSNVLEIGTGSGYNLAVLSKLTRKTVYSIERIRSLGQKAAAVLRRCGIKNVKVVVADGSKGLLSRSPYDRIIVTAGAFDRPPKPLLDQLAIGGIMIIPVKDTARNEEVLYKLHRTSAGYTATRLMNVRFVPLVEGSIA